MSGFLIALIMTLHIAVCIALMASILLQSGKGGGLAGTFGAGQSQTLFGGRGAATFLSRATTFLAVTFFLTSLTLGLNASRSTGMRRSLIQDEARRRGGERQTEIPGGGATTSPGPAPTQPTGQPTKPAPSATQMPGSAAPTQPAPQPTTAPTKRTVTKAATPSNPAPSTGTTATPSPSAPPAGTGTQAPSTSGTQAPTGNGTSTGTGGP